MKPGLLNCQRRARVARHGLAALVVAAPTWLIACSGKTQAGGNGGRTSFVMCGGEPCDGRCVEDVCQTADNTFEGLDGSTPPPNDASTAPVGDLFDGRDASIARDAGTLEGFPSEVEETPSSLHDAGVPSETEDSHDDGGTTPGVTERCSNGVASRWFSFPARNPRGMLSMPSGVLLLDTPDNSMVSEATLGDTVRIQQTYPLAPIYPNDALVLESGNLLISGADPASNMVWLGEVSGGELLWENTYASVADNAWTHVDLEHHPDQGYYVSTHAERTLFDPMLQEEETAYDVLLMHVLPSGEMTWLTSQPLADDVTVAINWSHGAITTAANGDAVQLTGATGALRLIRTDPSGEEVFDRIITLDVAEWPIDILTLPDGRFAVLSRGLEGTELAFVSDAGELLFERTFGQASSAEGDALMWWSAREELVIAGGSRAFGSAHAWLQGVDLDGTPTWSLEEEGTETLHHVVESDGELWAAEFGLSLVLAHVVAVDATCP